MHMAVRAGRKAATARVQKHTLAWLKTRAFLSFQFLPPTIF
jgi:hypothetical protein